VLLASQLSRDYNVTHDSGAIGLHLDMPTVMNAGLQLILKPRREISSIAEAPRRWCARSAPRSCTFRE